MFVIKIVLLDIMEIPLLNNAKLVMKNVKLVMEVLLINVTLVVKTII